MGRVASHWKHEIEKRGYNFLHIGEAQGERLPHPALYPRAAYRAYKRLPTRPSLVLVHEPAAGIFTRLAEPTIVFSHGVERRGWQLALQGKDGMDGKIRRRTRLLFPLWRLRQCDIGLRKASRMLLINNEDADFVSTYYGRKPQNFRVFRNGVNPSKLTEADQPENPTVLFVGSWLPRKGIHTLIDSAEILSNKGVRPKWILAGTGASVNDVLSSWPRHLHPQVEVVPRFDKSQEEGLFARASLFVLPSFFEGQPLALLQAMECGRCCITTNCCGQRDVIENRVNGLLHEPGDANAVADLITRGLSDEKLRMRIGKRAKESVATRQWETVASETVSWMEEAIRNPLSNGSGWAL